MKAAFYDPYLDTIGGGERYTLTLAEFLLKKGWKVDIFWDDASIKEKIIQRLGLSLEKINFVENVFQKSFLEKYNVLKNYDLVFYLSDGSIPLLFGKKKILHFQVPFHGVNKNKLLNKIKLKRIDTVVCNSFFTKKFIDKEFGTQSKVIYPPVEVKEFVPGKKENIILSVARFTDVLHNKRQDILVEVFKEMINHGLKDWQLFLVGGDDEGKQLVEKLKKEAEGYPIKILTNVSFSELKELYGKAKIFWHAAGFGIDEEKEPEKVEHFGITPIEAMAAGAVPVVIAKGEAPKIIKNNFDGYLWSEKKELAKISLMLINKPENLKKIAQNAQKSSSSYSKQIFCQKFHEII